MPETVTEKIHRPRVFADLSQREWAEKVRTLVEAKEIEARDTRSREGRKVLSVRAEGPSKKEGESGSTTLALLCDF